MASKSKDTAGETTPEPKAKQPTRADLLASLARLGYAGPLSFTATTLREVVAWMEGGSPIDGNVPKGVMLAVHPDLKPVPAAKTPRLSAHQRGFQEALEAVAALGDDLAAIQRWVEENRSKQVQA